MKTDDRKRRVAFSKRRSSTGSVELGQDSVAQETCKGSLNMYSQPVAAEYNGIIPNWHGIHACLQNISARVHLTLQVLDLINYRQSQSLQAKSGLRAV